MLVVFACLLGMGAATPSFGVDEEPSWREEIEVFRLGFVVREDAEDRELKRREAFRQYLEDQLRLPVRLIAHQDYGSLINAHTSKQLEYAIYSSSAYVISQGLCDCLDPLATSADGEQIGYYSVLFSRSERDDLKTIEDLDQKRVLLGRTKSIAGDLIPRFAFDHVGIKPNWSHQERGMVAALSQLGDPDVDAVAAWSSLTGDATTGYSRGTLTRLTLDERISPDDVKILWRSRLIPFGPHAVHTDLPELLKLELLDSLLSIPEQDLDLMEAAATPRSGPFRAIRPEAYAQLLDALKLSTSDNE